MSQQAESTSTDGSGSGPNDMVSPHSSRGDEPGPQLLTMMAASDDGSQSNSSTTGSTSSTSLLKVLTPAPETPEEQDTEPTTTTTVSNKHKPIMHRQSISYLGWIQVGALVRKNMLSKFRTPWGSFMELFSPVLMMLVLVLAYQLSTITNEPATQYDEIHLEIPGPWVELISSMGGYNDLDLTSAATSTTTKEKRRSLKRFAQADGFTALRDLAFPSTATTSASKRRLQQDPNSNSTETIFDLLDDASAQVSTLLTNPIPIPSIDLFVSASQAISSQIDPQDLPQILADSSYGRSWGNLLTLGTLHLSSSPSSDENDDDSIVYEFKNYLNETYPGLLDKVKIRIHNNQEEALAFINDNLNERTWALLDFNTRQDDFAYKIRMNYTTLPNTNRIINFVSIGLDRKYERYYLSGYLTLQRTLNEFALSRRDCEMHDFGNVWSMPMPTAAFNQNPFFQTVGFLLGLTIAMAYLYPTSRTIKTMVEEKESRMKETLYILGVRPWAHWLSWFVTTLLIFTVITIFVTWTLTSQVLMFSNAAYILVFMFFFSTCNVGFCFVVSACFSKAKLAAIVGPMALFATLLPRFIFFGTNRYEAVTAKRWASLLPCTAFAFGADIIADYEYAEEGIQPWNVAEGDYSFSTAVGFLIFDTLLYTFLGWYLELVIPRQYGVARPWYFLFLPSFWWDLFCCETRRHSREDRKRQDRGAATHSAGKEVEDLDFESVLESSWVPRIVIKNLVKRYSKKANVPPAVDKLNLTMYESQITCLLGHNGAGKTSTISVLTGLYPPTSGDCFIYGKSIVHDTDSARQSMGICPQQNILFESLTVAEHLRFFQRIKGMKPSDEDLTERAQEIGLGDYLRTTSVALSGGNKRKLSLAIALSGDPEFLLLDEPTSGMDVASRRACWELLREKRQGRVTLLTTHFLDEASLLADRIAVMKEGKLQCCGSELFLKNRFGLGYNLTVVIDVQELSASQSATTVVDDTETMEMGTRQVVSLMQGQVTDAGDVSLNHEEIPTNGDISSFLNSYIPGTKLIRRSARELTFRFPPGSEDKFSEVFNALELERPRLSIGAYGIADTTLEEIFLQLADHEDSITIDSEEPPAVGEKQTVAKHESVESVSQHELIHLGALGQIALLYKKRFIVQRRDPKGFFFQIVLPVLLCALVLLILTLEVPLAGPPIEMSMHLYSDGQNTLTEVLVGGGIALESTERRLSVEEEFEALSSTLASSYANANFVHLERATTSSDISQHLLDTYSSHDHFERYGAFAMHDQINMTFAIAWDKLTDDLNELAESGGLKNAVIDLTSLAKNSSMLDANATLSIIEEFLSQFVDMNETEALSVDASVVKDSTELAFSNTVGSASEADAVNAEAAVARLRSAFREFYSALASGNIRREEALVVLIGDIFSIITTGTIEDIVEGDLSLSAIIRPELFDRSVVEEQLLNVIADLIEELGGNEALAQVAAFVPLAFDSLINFLDPDLAEAPVILTVIPIVILDEVASDAIREGGPDATFTLRDIIDAFTDAAGLGVNGIVLRADSAVIDLSDFTIRVENLELVSENGNVIASRELIVIETLPILEVLLPSGNTSVTIGLESNATILHNASSPHAVSSFNQAYMEFVYKQCIGPAAELMSINHPLPLTDQQSIEIKTVLSILASLFLLIPYCYIPGAFLVFVVKERVSKSKHLQLVSGVELTSYWISSYLWDLTLFLILTILIMLVFLLYGSNSAEVFVGSREAFVATMLLTFGYGLSVLPFSYLWSRMFDNHSSAQIAVMGIVFITGFVFVNAYFIMSTIPSTQNLAEAMRPLFRSFPAYNVGEGFINLSSAYWEREILGADKSPLDWDVAGKSLTIIYALAPEYLLLLLLLEYSADGGSGGLLGRVLRRLRGSYTNMLLSWHGVSRCPDGVTFNLDDGLDEGRQGDEDVMQERSFVDQNQDDLKTTAAVLLVNMWKVFPPTVGSFGFIMQWVRRAFRNICCCRCLRWGQERPRAVAADLPKRAVRGISTAVMDGETYGLLGVNGAGKSSSLGVLTGDISPTGGQAYVAGSDVTGLTPGGVAEARKHIGFCPQVDPLLDLMTGRETLTMFGRLRGIPVDRLNQTVTNLLSRLTLTPHADKVSESYSGGNKRKLSLGVALIGDPRVLFIDEASSGMDPSTRRKTWALIEEAAQKRSVVLTSHSMEEVEALCTRVGIMVDGQFLCLGSVQHLKSKYLNGYTVNVQCFGGDDENVLLVIDRIIAEALPGATLVERHGQFLRFEVASISNHGLGCTFRKLQELKETTCMSNYSLSQASLEQVFIKLVNESRGDSNPTT